MSTEKMYAKAEIPCCDEKEVHVDKVRYVNENMPPEDKLYDLAELFKTFGDSTRIRILFALFEAEICVGSLTPQIPERRLQPYFFGQISISYYS